MKNSKANNKRPAVLVVILIALLIVGYKVMFVAPQDDLVIEENIAASQRVESILVKVQSISFDMGVLENQKFQSLESLEIPLPNLPIGKKNPFSGPYSSN